MSFPAAADLQGVLSRLSRSSLCPPRFCGEAPFAATPSRQELDLSEVHLSEIDPQPYHRRQ